MPLIPVIQAKQVDVDDIIIDAKSGMTGAGRAAKEEMLFSEVSEGIHAYGVGKHRHAPEIEQGLSRAAGKAVVVNFTPHLMPMNRGILSTIYVRLVDGAKPADLRATLTKRYADEAFVKVMAEGVSPQTRHVRGSNYVHIGVFADRVPGRAILICVEDNLVKGASGQAIQNMNLMAGLPETTGLLQEALFP
jgi:N-acetyl-gamma-glutamyl-phosphate reductase